MAPRVSDALGKENTKAPQQGSIPCHAIPQVHLNPTPMGYSTNKQTLEDFRHQLTYLEQGKEQVWLTQMGESAKVAYKIRECLYIARLYKDEYPGLAAASEKMVVEIIAPNKVQARSVTSPTEAVLATQGGEDKPHESPVTGTSDHRRKPGLATSGPQTAFTVMDVWRLSQPSNDPIYFPDAAMDDTNLTLLYNWASNRTPRLMLLVDGPALTLGVAEADVEQFSWRPASNDSPPTVSNR